MSLVTQHRRKIGIGLIVLGLLLVAIWVGQTAVAVGSLVRSLKTAQVLLDGNPLGSSH